VSRRDRTEVTIRERVTHVVELGVVEGVEEFGTEFQPAAASLAEQEALE